ncbi:GapA-binding peptide SR1P [Paenibacillus sp.]|uniref:GapA-binding peptide SR1P n=1 Tax=Paenibacillus sp. TaxID=58172 RepID=UPI00281266E2|nr:GapA-binding peptide SR1P [Paenibacillus sp.]
MERNIVETGRNHLGTILCKRCGETIGTLDTERAIVYYSVCEREQCGERMESGDDAGVLGA